jgi:glycosyltransferase involved in cell wall biosynthesis
VRALAFEIPMSDTPLVSIVVPAYNLGHYLAATIESILAQDYPRVELIVIDDGSTDNTREVLARYTGRLHWESQPNAGQVAAMNRGFAMAQGEILSWIGADDLLLPDAASTSVRQLEAHPDIVLTYCDFNQIDPNGRIIRRIRTPDYSYRAMVAKVICPPGPGAFFRRSAWQATGAWDTSLKIMLDYDYWLRLGLRGPFMRIPKVLALYRIHPGQETFSRMDQNKAAEPVRVITRLFELHTLPADLPPLKARALGNAHLVSAQLHFRAGRYRAFFASLREAFALCPANFFTWRALRLAANVMFNRTGQKFLWKMNSLLRK